MFHHLQTIGIAMSGGVDSTTAAGLLLEQGFSVAGFFMLLPLPGSDEQAERVRRIADRLSIPLHVVDVRQQFRQTVVSSFAAAYSQGLTPNPCIDCNRLIKFGLLLEAMTAQGMDKMATGHYARVDRNVLRRGCDPTKDQSYFLCRLSRQQLSRLVLPLGSWQKKNVFERARAMGFDHFDAGGESQDVCFLADKDLASFLAEQGMKNSRGDIRTSDGRLLGQHQGIWKYTVGQRRGLGIPDATPWYVTALDAEQNLVVAGKSDELFRREIILSNVQWQMEPPKQHWHGLVQARSRHRAAKAEAERSGNGGWRVCFAEPQRALAPGQLAVFYHDDCVVGSGVIQANWQEPCTTAQEF